MASIMNKKIIQFLSEAGYDRPVNEPAALQLIRYFEETYGVSLMGLLEKEWVDEQLTKDLTHHDFEVLRDAVDQDHIDDFDKTIARIEAYEL